MLIWLAALSQAHAQLNTGDAVVIDFDAGTGSRGALFSVDRSTGVRTVLSNFGDEAQGPLGGLPFGVAVEASGDILVVDQEAGTSFAGALFRVDPSSGTRTLVSDFGDEAQGPLGVNPTGAAVEPSGNILVVDSGEADSAGALFRVSPSSGGRTLVSDFADAAQGPMGVEPFGVAIDASGSIFVVDYAAGTNSAGTLLRINPLTGARTLLSNFGNAAQGPLGVQPFGVAIESSGSILVADFEAQSGFDAGSGNAGAVFRVDASTGERTLLSNFGDSAQGGLGKDPVGVAVDASGAILVLDQNAGTGSVGVLFSVDTATGARTFISGFGEVAQGPLGVNPIGLAVVRDLGVCNGQAPSSGCTVNGVPSQACLGTSGDDTIIGTEGADVIVGLAGNDTISGGAGNDVICGGAGNDTLVGGKKPDQLLGQDGDDTLRGGRGPDALDGGNGNDTCVGGLGSDGAANCETVSNVP